MTMQIQLRRDTAANWTAEDPTLTNGEIGYETDTGRMKMGDGSTAWTALGYLIIEAPVAGDVIFGDATPKWAKLAKGDNGEVLTLVAGLPAWAAGGGGVAEADLQFLDNFGDAARHWGWFDDAKSGSIVEAGGLLTLSIANLTDGRLGDTNQNKAPRVLMGDPGAPFEVKVRLNSYAVNDFTHAGIFVCADASGGSKTHWYCFGRAKDSNWVVDGLGAWTNEAWEASNAITTLPIYLRFRINVLVVNSVAFVEAAYSTDDIAYTVLDTFDLSGLSNNLMENMVVGIFARNGVSAVTYNALAAPFEWFKMGRTLGPG